MAADREEGRTGGYDGAPEKKERRVMYTLTKEERMYSSKIVCTLRRNGIASGLLYLGSEEEFHWLCDHVTGVFESKERDDPDS